jgi:uncharacterized protein (TIGR02117 family)
MKAYLARMLFSVLCVLALAATSGAHSSLADASQSNGRTRTIFLLHNGWHAALAVRESDIVLSEFPEKRDFPGAEYFEISWGDADYFPDPNAGMLGAIKAGLWSSGSVIHIVGFVGAVEKIYRDAEIIEITLTSDRFGRLIAFIGADFSRPDPGTKAIASPGLFPNSRFYPARSKFSALRTCNTWLAEALHAAGLPVNPRSVITAGQLAEEVRRHARESGSN